jgi:hypothetical protein
VKNYILFSCLVLILAGCGQPSSSTSGPSAPATTVTSQLTSTLASSGLVRSWQQVGGSDEMIVATDGTVTGSACGTHATITSITPASSGCPANAITCGSGTLNVVATNGASGCLTVGTSNCSYSTFSASNSTVELGFNCGNGALNYLSQ